MRRPRRDKRSEHACGSRARIAKYFDAPTPKDEDHQEIYYGTIDKYIEGTKLWHIRYDDDDEDVGIETSPCGRYIKRREVVKYRDVPGVGNAVGPFHFAFKKTY